MNTTVSIIVPVYNNVSGISQVVKLLLAQSYDHQLEIIIVDNGSTDGTANLIRNLSKEHESVRAAFENNVQSSYAARNQGIQESNGAILAFTDSDCLPDSEWIKAGTAELERSNAACGGGHVEVTFGATKPTTVEYLDASQKLDQERYVKNHQFAATANFFARKELFDRRGLFRPDLVSGGDYEFGRRVTKAGESLIYIPKAIVRHPARRTYSEVLKKSRRIAKGQKQLDGLGLAGFKRPLWRQMLPAKSWPQDGFGKETLGRADKLKLLAMQTGIRWLNFLIRIT